MELAAQLVELVGRLTEERPEVNLHAIRHSTDERLVYIERCRIYLQSRNRHHKKMMCSAWSALDVDDQFELNELAYWQTGRAQGEIPPVACEKRPVLPNGLSPQSGTAAAPD